MCGLFLGAHKSLAPRARTLLDGLGQATLSFFAVAALLFVFFGECPKFCDLAKQRRKIVGGVSEVGKGDFSLHFFWRCVIFLVFSFLLLRSRDACEPCYRRRPARAHAVGPVLDPHARTDRTRDTRVAEPRLPAPEDGLPGEGQRLTPDAPHNSGRPPPPGTTPHHPRGTQPPQGVQAKRTVLGPHTHTPAPTARGWRTPTARPVGGQSGEGQRLTSDAPHNGGRHPPRGRPSATPTASNAGPQGRTLWGRCWVPTPAPTAPGTHGTRNPGCPLQRMGGRGRDSA